MTTQSLSLPSAINEDQCHCHTAKGTGLVGRLKSILLHLKTTNLLIQFGTGKYSRYFSFVLHFVQQKSMKRTGIIPLSER